jgi:hypothetical protein
LQDAGKDIMRKIFILFLSVCCIISFTILAGCGGKYFNYSLMLINSSGEDLSNVVVKSSAGIIFKLYIVSNGTTSIYHGPFEYPPNDLFEISWQTNSADIYKANIDLKNLLKKHYKGFVVFEINKHKSINYYAKIGHEGESLFFKTTNVATKQN